LWNCPELVHEHNICHMLSSRRVSQLAALADKS
jgi:hypothetical protein